MTLDGTYERVLLGIDREKREHAIRLFQCLAFSRRPLLAKELAEVLAIQFDAAIPGLNTSLRPEDADEAVLSACSTLVTIIEPDDDDGDNDDNDHDNSRVVQFSHYSVKEYLTSERLAKSYKGDLSKYHISPNLAHAVLAQACISTLLQPDLRINDITDSFPLAVYAARNWFHHARCDGVAPQIQDGMERLFDPSRTHFETWVSIHDIDGHGPWPRTRASPLYYAVLCGIESLVVHLITTRGQDPNQSRGNKGASLRAAMVSGHTAIARLLLEHAADVNAQHTNGITLLHEAATCGNLEITQLLLSHGAVVNSSDGLGHSPLHKATQSQKHGVLELLLKRGADIDARNRDGETPLHEAARSGNFDIVKFLLSRGADVEAFDGTRNSPLHKAVLSQKLDVVELLLKGGAYVNAWDEYDSTPLHEAAKSGRSEIVQSLLSHGADIRILDYKSDCPLHMAARSPEFGVVELLLKSGADLYVRNMYNSTPLDEAARSRNPEILQLLLSHGAVVDTLNDEGNSSWHDPIRSRNLDVVKHLLKAGAGVVVNICKPLGDAAVHGSEKISGTLYEARGSPWHKAVRSPKLCVAKLTAMGFADLDHSPYFILLLKTLSELASWCTSGVWTFGNLDCWSHGFVKRLLVLLVLQWWSIPLRASIREVLGELFKELFPRFLRKEAMNRVNFSVFFTTFGVTLVTHVVTYRVTLPLPFNLIVTSSGSTSTRILLEVLLLLHAHMSLMMELDRGISEALGRA
jgi:ankyrin repeat protein